MTVDTVERIFSRVLDAPQVGPETDFFDQGGDSLLATRVLSAIARETGVELTIDDFLLAPTPAGLARTIAGAGR
ncbi:acyl carrier protein [Micromonospora sp. B11E3]|uniref:acyl carrier protein n=1 Tax=unclassified Micromonospora TaxID=2617518 RepID=UPI00325C8085